MLLLLASILVLQITTAHTYANSSVEYRPEKREWCQDNEATRCAGWKAKGVCRSTSPRVQHAMKKLCYDTCNFCKPPPAEVCYNEKYEVSKYGCCWDGIMAATGPHGQGCPVCENSKSRYFCSMWKDVCFTKNNWEYMRINCPETCGYCKKAPSPCKQPDSGAKTVCKNDCYDVEPQKLCEHRKWSGYCDIPEWKDYLEKKCARTCAFCGKDECRDFTLTRVCAAWKEKYRCENAGSIWNDFMKRACMLTCGFCIPGPDKTGMAARNL